jgi:hypothetical protein
MSYVDLFKKYLLQAWYSWLSPVLLAGEPFPPEFTPDSFIPLGRAFLGLSYMQYCFLFLSSMLQISVGDLAGFIEFASGSIISSQSRIRIHCFDDQKLKKTQS